MKPAATLAGLAVLLLFAPSATAAKATTHDPPGDVSRALMQDEPVEAPWIDIVRADADVSEAGDVTLRVTLRESPLDARPAQHNGTVTAIFLLRLRDNATKEPHTAWTLTIACTIKQASPVACQRATSRVGETPSQALAGGNATVEGTTLVVRTWLRPPLEGDGIDLEAMMNYVPAIGAEDMHLWDLTPGALQGFDGGSDGSDGRSGLAGREWLTPDRIAFAAVAVLVAAFLVVRWRSQRPKDPADAARGSVDGQSAAPPADGPVSRRQRREP